MSTSEKSAGETPALWDVPPVAGGDTRGHLTAGRLEAIQKDAFDEAWEKGFEDGLRAGEEAARERVERLDAVLTALSKPFDDLDEEVENAVVELAMTATRQLFRRETSQTPTHVIGVVREAIQLLPIASRNVQIVLHPDDAAIIREHLSPAEGQPAWTILEDPLITKGGCRITTENSVVDASVEARLAALIQSISGDART